MLVFIGLVILIIVVFLVEDSKDRLEHINPNLSSMDDFSPSIKVVGDNKKYVFAVDQEREKVFIMTWKYRKVFSFNDIISVKLIEDNQVVVEKSTGRTIGGALIGGMLGGGRHGSGRALWGF